MQTHMFWENDHGGASVRLISNGQCFVSLFDIEQEVETLQEAGDLLRRIFADEIAAVRAYANEQFVYSGLAPTHDPSAGFHVLDGFGSARDMPEIDHVTIETWSRGMLPEVE